MPPSPRRETIRYRPSCTGTVDEVGVAGVMGSSDCGHRACAAEAPSLRGSVPDVATTCLPSAWLRLATPPGPQDCSAPATVAGAWYRLPAVHARQPQIQQYHRGRARLGQAQGSLAVAGNLGVVAPG